MRSLALVAAGRSRRRNSRHRLARLPRGAGWALWIVVLLVAVALVRFEPPASPWTPGPADEAPAGEAVSGAIRVVDGDTLDVAGERIRIVNIDTPEMPPKAECASEADGALRARDSLDTFVRAGSVTLERTGTDRYGRTLAHVRVDGEDAGEALVAAGLARPWDGRRRSWCA